MPLSGGGITFLSPSSYEFNFTAGFQGIKLMNHWMELTLSTNLFSRRGAFRSIPTPWAQTTYFNQKS